MAQDAFSEFEVQAPPAADPFAEFAGGGSPAPKPPSGGINPWVVGAGAVGLGAAALAAKNPALLKTAANGVNDLRRMSMLSGLAPLKSLLGNVGSAAYGSIEHGSLAPLREMLSMETARDAARTFKAGPSYASAGPSTGITKFNLPGRIMGSMDTAAQNALVRAGYTPENAAVEMLQGEQHGPFIKSLQDNPIADYLVPFRRTPFNQITEGFNSMKPENLQTFGQKAALGTSLAAGAATGHYADDPKTIALGTAASGRRGLPFAMAAGVSRMLSTGSKSKGADVLQGMSPVSDYSLSQGVLGPFVDPTGSVIPKPAAIPAYDYIKKLLGMQ